MTNDHEPPGSNSQVANVLVNPAGPHHAARRALSANAANTLAGPAAISRDARNVMALSSCGSKNPISRSPSLVRSTLPLFRVLPEGAVNGPHRQPGTPADATEMACIRPPEREAVGRNATESNRPERTDV